MENQMKSVANINDELLCRARQQVINSGTTFQALVE
jgi:hypothetical protein